jgi:hypothetical protein
MNQTVLPQFACFLMRGGGPITRSEIILILLVAGAIMLVGICWQLIDKWIERTRGRNWPRVSAVVDLVSVTFCEDNTPSLKADLNFPYYLATLTYFYRNPEQQTGYYSRRFGDKAEAEAWANSYKGETVNVHVDPSDPGRSVLREEDL